MDLRTPESPNGREVLVPSTRRHWREWLDSHPTREEGVWVVYRKKNSSLDGPAYDDLVEEALCFGWIDSQARRVDEDRRMQWFSPRRRGSIWSLPNKERVRRLEVRGLMTQRGRVAIEAAKAEGSWSRIDDVEALRVHPDLEEALAAQPDARRAYEDLPDSTKKQYLWWVYSAKRPSTRADRIAELAGRLTAGE